MFQPNEAPRLFACPPGADFAAALVDGLITRMADRPPESMARVTLYLNSARMMRAVRRAFDLRGARLLPRLRLVTDLAQMPVPGLPAPMPPLRRRLELARLIAALIEHQPDFAPGAAVFDLADSLAALMSEMQGEGVTPDALESPDLVQDHAEHWARSLTFLRIAGQLFPPETPLDAEGRQRAVADALARRWAENPPRDPVIVAGSTGSRGATALFMQMVARLPQGAVVLPGFDFDMPPDAWDALESGAMPDEDHPQYRFLALARALGISPRAVRPWTDTPPPDPLRNRLISLALRPAPVTDRWMAEAPALGPVHPATRELTLIEAQGERQEALAIALILREASEHGQRAALITPDRNLARRVSAALDRWDIRPDDSAGQPLVQSAPGRLLRHTAQLFGRQMTAETLVVLLKHPLTATGGQGRGDHLRFSRDLELDLRRYGPAFPTPQALLAWAQRKEDPDRTAWAAWLGKVLEGFDRSGHRTLDAWIADHLAVTEALASGPGGSVEASELWRTEAGREAQTVMQDLMREAAHGPAMSPGDYADLLAGLLRPRSVRHAEAVHPHIQILGTLEARAQSAELVILGGLNDGIWPALPAPDPWLSRQMRHRVGLLSPERQVGLSAHDFQIAACAPRVVLSRAIRDSEAETVPSRWLARLTNLLGGLPDQGGPAALEEMRARGTRYLRLAQAIEDAPRRPPEPRPAPRPPVSARPRTLPVTGITRLIRDPYAVYAREILRLRPLDPLRPEPDARLRGEVLHELVECFIRDWDGGDPHEARARLLRLTDEVLERGVPWPSARRIWRARIARLADTFIAEEIERRGKGSPALIEQEGSVALPDLDFTLRARPDRIDLLANGRVHIYDYKTGKPPSPAQQRAFEKQLILEAAMVERGGFSALGPRKVEGISYIQIGGEGRESPAEMEDGQIEEEWQGLIKLIRRWMQRETGYVARRAVFESRRVGDYDHLARFGEWQMSDRPTPIDVGPQEETGQT
ncbi:ATP-dependent helicase/nuclease subunit B [Albidovulum inexpectatum]|uniref:ATP-dependent helicase/nuclease subunit B n=1 Tax=Albidovulum inexpectatum TaxID=196587 RepID=A0A2S5JMH8_9RHOB|nr:double-strand break repair protein AddB [Albidovulum inexpectatum]PPB82694.1 ATP-dependent helicase/nuclease subunit B [Albidovulum inexpectatum]